MRGGIWNHINRKNRNEKAIKSNAGFTLVELIVVLVILAILAALLIPALSGYIDRAKEEQYVSYARNALMATQSVLSEMYAKGDTVDKLDPDDVRDLIDDTGLNDVGFVYFGSNVKNDNGVYNYKVVEKEVYKILGACYIYQVNAGESYRILYYDGKSWTQLEEEASAMGRAVPPSGARGIVYSQIFQKYYQNSQHAYQYYIHITE